MIKWGKLEMTIFIYFGFCLTFSLKLKMKEKENYPKLVPLFC